MNKKTQFLTNREKEVFFLVNLIFRSKDTKDREIERANTNFIAFAQKFFYFLSLSISQTNNSLVCVLGRSPFLHNKMNNMLLRGALVSRKSK